MILKFLRLLARPWSWLARHETSGGFSTVLPPADFVLLAGVTVVYRGFAPKRVLQVEDVLLLAAAVVVVHLLGLGYARTKGPGAGWRIVRLLGANLAAACVIPFVCRWLEIPLRAKDTAVILGLFAPLQVILHLGHARARAGAPLEPWRRVLLGAGALALAFPFLTNNSVGTGDAYWYAGMVGDFATQWRAGIFPVFAGQSDYAFNGAVSPLRFAPYLQHAAAVLDVLTRHTLSFFGLVNLTLVLSLAAAAFACYAALLALHRATPWLALLLALLWVASPAVLSLAYGGDLFMSVCALPYLPWMLLALERTFTRRDLRSLGSLAASLAALWLCHAPIAFWATFVAGLGQLFRLPAEARSRDAWRGWLTGAAIFAVLTAFVFVSVATLHLPAPAADRQQIVKNLGDAFPGALLPVSENANALSDYQLGWSLWWVLLAGVVATAFRRRAFGLTLLASAVFFLLLLLPIPHVLRAMWNLMPATVCDITFFWPMQRLYPLLAAIAVFLAYAGCAAAVRRWWLHLAAAIALLVALQWSAAEAEPFLRRGLLNEGNAQTSAQSEFPANRILTRYAFSPFPAAPPYFSHGYVDPVWENRLLARDSLREIDSNYRALTGSAASVRAQGAIRLDTSHPESLSYPLLAGLSLEPHRSYALEFEFEHPELAGSLLASSPTVVRVYTLPNSGAGIPGTAPSTAFGALPTSKHAFSVATAADTPETLDVQFILTRPATGDISQFGRYVLKEYDLRRLPVVVENWTPYRARVTAAERAWLETPRLFLAGYRATVNGRDVPAERSPTGLVMIPVEAGESRITLAYRGPLILRLSYFLSLAGWIAVIFSSLLSRLRRGKDFCAA